MMLLSSNEMVKRGLQLMGFSEHRIGRVKNATSVQRFKAYFIVKPAVAAKVWKDVKDLPSNGNNNRFEDW